MKVILLERLGRLGNVGQVVDVKPGFARNFLLPRSKALRASDDNLKVFEAQRSQIEARNAQAKAEAEAKAKKLEGASITLQRQASDEGKLFGSVTVRDVAEAMLAVGYEVEKSQILIPANIKNTGVYTATINLHADVQAPVAVNVTRIELEAA